MQNDVDPQIFTTLAMLLNPEKNLGEKKLCLLCTDLWHECRHTGMHMNLFFISLSFQSLSRKSFSIKVKAYVIEGIRIFPGSQ